ncbi:nucleotide exchange factor GrpE [Candidatus Desantisbacteria bacterium CG_4_10_14_0_8_um_filter_48_22]|uniref:Protein GrpE n=1 Tax=Candidatus Desantisbacteria bacterium CG_4_10_14_0_8_um_filter_48_22 TaxID=1974543 RepID=A0A2M7SFG9_9BACT|nr:MAG: nucleotide exchange factor GrpE [Candidatus Desantisbacteria bacterium CG1_02_49_89]PIZ18248.1 MAG: nucleotide exchange factor GrpE [Candidatus Desantisbacteria bacterium CG_4_10_14_0_8_um_filter_48_22]
MNEKTEEKIGDNEQLRREIEEKSALCKEYLDHLVRLKAEFENFKKRADKEKLEYVKFSNADLIRQVLPVIESLEMGLGAAKSLPGAQELVKGLEMVVSELQEILESNGLTRIETKGRLFDPHVHEVVEHVEVSSSAAENEIIEEVKAGYILYGRVLCPALVKIAKKVKS